MPKARPATLKAPKAPKTRDLATITAEILSNPGDAAGIIEREKITDPGIVVKLMQAAMEAQIQRERERRDAPQALEIVPLAKKGKLQVRFKFPKYEGGGFSGGVWMNAENAPAFWDALISARNRAIEIAADLPQSREARDRHKRQFPGEYQETPKRPNFS